VLRFSTDHRPRRPLRFSTGVHTHPARLEKPITDTPARPAADTDVGDDARARDQLLDALDAESDEEQADE
jgi:hypothetical protein